MLKNKLKLVLFTGIVFAGLIYADDASAETVCSKWDDYGNCTLYIDAKNEHGDGSFDARTCSASTCQDASAFNTETHLYLKLKGMDKPLDVTLCSENQYTSGDLSRYGCYGYVIPGLENALTDDGDTNTNYQKKMDELLNDVVKDGDWNLSNPLTAIIINSIYDNSDCEGKSKVACAKQVLIDNYYDPDNNLNDMFDIAYSPCMIVNTIGENAKRCVRDVSDVSIKDIPQHLIDNMCHSVIAGTAQNLLGINLGEACSGTADITAVCTTTTTTTTVTTPSKPTDDCPGCGGTPRTLPTTTTANPNKPPEHIPCANNDCSPKPDVPYVDVPTYPTSTSNIPPWSCGSSYAASLVENGGNLGDASCGEFVINTYTISASAVQNDVNVKAGHSFDWGYTNGSVTLNQSSTPGTRASALLWNAVAKLTNLQIHRDNAYNEWVQIVNEMMDEEHYKKQAETNAKTHEDAADRDSESAGYYDSLCSSGTDWACNEATGYRNSASEHQRQADEYRKAAVQHGLKIGLLALKEIDAAKKYNNEEKNLSEAKPRLEKDIATFGGCVEAVNSFQPGVETIENAVTTSNEALTLNGYKQLKGTALAIDKNTGNIIYDGMTYDNGFTVNKDNLPANSLAIRNALDLFFVPLRTLSGTYKGVLTEDIFINAGTNGLNFNMSCNLVVDNKVYVCTDDDCPDPPPTIVTCSNPPCPLPVNLGMNVIFRPISLTTPFPDADSLSSRERVGKWYYDSTVLNIITNNRGVNPDGSGNSYDVYNKVPMYTITLTPTDIKEIREYNKTHSYNDFDMSCDDGLYCKSNFIWTTFNKIVDYSNSCAMDSDWYACDGLPRDFMEGYYHYLK